MARRSWPSCVAVSSSYSSMPWSACRFPTATRERMTKTGPRGLGVVIGVEVDDVNATAVYCRMTGCTVTTGPVDAPWGSHQLLSCRHRGRTCRPVGARRSTAGPSFDRPPCRPTGCGRSRRRCRPRLTCSLSCVRRGRGCCVRCGSSSADQQGGSRRGTGDPYPGTHDVPSRSECCVQSSSSSGQARRGDGLPVRGMSRTAWPLSCLVSGGIATLLRGVEFDGASPVRDLVLYGRAGAGCTRRFCADPCHTWRWPGCWTGCAVST